MKKIKPILKKIIMNLITISYRVFYKLVPVNSKTVLFIAFHGKGYLCNPKYIHQYMSEADQYKDYHFVWAIKNPADIQIPDAKVVKYNSVAYFYYLAKSRYWIFNCKMPSYIVKKKNQIYLQTWHGTPLKRLGHDIDVSPDATFYRSQVTKSEMMKSYDEDAKKYDYFVSPNAFSTEKFLSAFKVEQRKIIETGYPRNDFITNITSEEISALKLKYNIPKDKKVILYAPTWRDNSYNNKGYIFELQADFKMWQKQLGDEYVLIFKPHYLIVNQYKGDRSLDGFLYCIDEDADINDLYVMSDVLITDYSSVFFDYAVLNRPILFYMYDLQQYQDEIRGFYLDIYTDLPGQIVTKEMELINLLQHIDDYTAQNNNKLATFNARFNNLQDGNCAKKVVECVIK